MQNGLTEFGTVLLKTLKASCYDKNSKCSTDEDIFPFTDFILQVDFFSYTLGVFYLMRLNSYSEWSKFTVETGNKILKVSLIHWRAEK